MKKVNIITGFLGAGKTSFLNHYLRIFSSQRFAIIENELGEQSIDSNLIIPINDSIVELNNGCLCCSLNENLYDILQALQLKREAFDEVIIEATGIANPSGIAEPFLLHPTIKSFYQLDKIICLIDAAAIHEQLSWTQEALQQISFSNILLINKSDLVRVEAVHNLKQILRQINPLATIITTQINNFPDAAAITTWPTFQQIGDLVAVAETQSPLKKCGCKKTDTCSHDVAATSSHTQHAIEAAFFQFHEPFNLALLHLLLMQYVRFQAKDLYRMKAIVFVEDQQNPVLFQSVGQRIGIEEYLPEFNPLPHRESKFVFIGKQIPKAGIEQLLKKAIAKEVIQK